MSIFALFMMTTAVYAHDPSPTMTVWSKRSYDYLRAKYPTQRIEYMDQNSLAEDNAEEGYLPPHARDKIFDRLGLTQPLAKVDQLDKDMLVMSVRDADAHQIAALARKYPMLSTKQLRRLKDELGRTK